MHVSLDVLKAAVKYLPTNGTRPTLEVVHVGEDVVWSTDSYLVTMIHKGDVSPESVVKSDLDPSKFAHLDRQSVNAAVTMKLGDTVEVTPGTDTEGAKITGRDQSVQSRRIDNGEVPGMDSLVKGDLYGLQWKNQSFRQFLQPQPGPMGFSVDLFKSLNKILACFATVRITYHGAMNDRGNNIHWWSAKVGLKSSRDTVTVVIGGMMGNDRMVGQWGTAPDLHAEYDDSATAWRIDGDKRLLPDGSVYVPADETGADAESGDA